MSRPNGRGKGVSASRIADAEDRAKLFREKMAFKKENEDTIIRTELQGLISARINEGINKERVVEELSANPRYSKYQMFFESWVDHVIRRNEVQKQRGNNQNRGR